MTALEDPKQGGEGRKQDQRAHRYGSQGQPQRSRRRAPRPRPPRAKTAPKLLSPRLEGKAARREKRERDQGKQPHGQRERIHPRPDVGGDDPAPHPPPPAPPRSRRDRPDGGAEEQRR